MDDVWMIYLLEMVDLSIVFCKRLPEGSSIVVIMAGTPFQTCFEQSSGQEGAPF